ncbi:MAG: pentapeptide repeat-containing protein, partial [Candidatus Nanopelagicaceae bacterium]
VYLKQDKQERRPHDPNKKFASGEFTKLFQKALETVDLIFSDGIDWQAFLASFEKLQVECGSDELAIQAIENKSGGAFVIRVEVPSKANKAEIEKYFKQEYETKLKVIEDKYQNQLQAKDEEIKKAYREKSIDLLEMARIMASVQKSDIHNHIEATGNKSVSETYESKYDLSQAQVGGIVDTAQTGSNPEFHQHNYAPEQKQTLAEAAAEIQKLLNQLEKSNPNATVEQQQ